MNKLVRRGTLAIALISALSFSLAGCGTSNSAKTDTAKEKKVTASATKTKADAQKQASFNQYIVIEPGAKLGSDGKLHDAFINGDIKVTEGQPVTLNFLNYDEGTHTYTSADLGINVKIKGSSKKGEPGITSYTFTPKKQGEYAWLCADPCDGGNGQWAMSQDGYMKGKITVLPSTNNVQYVSMVMNPDYKLGSDGNLHDAYTPGDFNVKAGVPVELTVYNYGKNPHPIAIKDLGANVNVTPRKNQGDASITTVTFTPEKAGKYMWNCTVSCDSKYNDWAMVNDNYMMGFFNVEK